MPARGCAGADSTVPPGEMQTRLTRHRPQLLPARRDGCSRHAARLRPCRLPRPAQRPVPWPVSHAVQAAAPPGAPLKTGRRRRSRTPPCTGWYGCRRPPPAGPGWPGVMQCSLREHGQAADMAPPCAVMLRFCSRCRRDGAGTAAGTRSGLQMQPQAGPGSALQAGAGTAHRAWFAVAQGEGPAGGTGRTAGQLTALRRA